MLSPTSALDLRTVLVLPSLVDDSRLVMLDSEKWSGAARIMVLTAVRKMIIAVRARSSCSDVVRVVFTVLANVDSDGGGGGSGMNVAGRMCIEEPRRDTVVEERIVLGDETKSAEMAMRVMAAASIKRNEDRSAMPDLGDCCDLTSCNI